jgi:5-(aminomethyl)-3-furanmethanol phosphate kinase
MLCDKTVVTSLEELMATALRCEPSRVVFDSREYLRDHEPHQPGQPLEHNWNVTSDSIAARLAQAIRADELVLLKSCDFRSNSLTDLAKAGVVDPYFPRAAAGLGGVRVVNLRGLAD